MEIGEGAEGEELSAGPKSVKQWRGKSRQSAVPEEGNARQAGQAKDKRGRRSQKTACGRHGAPANRRKGKHKRQSKK